MIPLFSDKYKNTREVIKGEELEEKLFLQMGLLEAIKAPEIDLDDLCQFIQNDKVNVNFFSSAMMPLFAAVMQAKSLEKAKLLIENGAIADIYFSLLLFELKNLVDQKMILPDGSPDFEGMMRGFGEVLDYFISKGLNPNGMNMKGETLLSEKFNEMGPSMMGTPMETFLHHYFDTILGRVDPKVKDKEGRDAVFYLKVIKNEALNNIFRKHGVDI